MSHKFLIGATMGIVAGALMAENKQLKKFIDKGMQSVKSNMCPKSNGEQFSGNGGQQ